MMKNIVIPAVILLLFTGTGCNNDANTEIESTGPVPIIVAPQISDTNANKIQPVPVTTTPATITSKPVSTAGLNPAHGQPGHRCDIAVGAPLDSKPVQPTTQTQPVTNSTTPLTTTPATITPNPVSTAGLNPAHGQPGHRCDIAVGAPLDSKPVQPTTQTQPVTNSTTPLTTTPVTAGAGLNPAHGQPGHRCDIAVGAPLDSKPAQKQ